MSQRTLRVNALLKREISTLIHTVYPKATVAITITEVSTAADLRNARVYYSVVGDAAARAKAKAFFARNHATLRYQIGRRIVLKYLPALQFIYDGSIERGTRLLDIIDQLEDTDPLSSPTKDATDSIK